MTFTSTSTHFKPSGQSLKTLSVNKSLMATFDFINGNKRVVLAENGIGEGAEDDDVGGEEEEYVEFG
jgi:hypothetical protein